MARKAVLRGQRALSRQQASSTVSMPAPIGGWNARDSIDAMSPGDAVRLDNWFPDSDRVALRSGYTEHVSIGSAEIETLHEYQGGSSNVLLAFTDGKIYDATSAATLKASGFTNDRWQCVNFNGYTVMANGADSIRTFNGSSVSTTSFTGVTLSTLIHVTGFKSRLYFVEKDSASFWYGGVGEVTGGTLTEFDLGQIAQRGGYLVAQESWSRDAGDGPDDYLVNIMSSGEILVYAGSDPGSDFSLVGRYYAAQPIGRRCTLKIGGELIVVTKQGYLPMSVLMSDGTADSIQNHPVWGKIQRAIRDATGSYSGNFGWQPILSPTGAYAVFNVPVDEGVTYQQHVLNTTSGAWCRYTGVPARCWGTLSGSLYFGGAGKVYKMSGSSDDGADIIGYAKSAFSYVGERGAKKRFTALRPVIATDGDIDVGVAVDVDFSERDIPSLTSSFSSTSGGSAWDDDDWDDAVWADSTVPTNQWVSVQGIGRNVAIRLETRAQGQNIYWYSTDLLGERGAVR